MKCGIDRDLHIHSFLSDCSLDAAQTPEAILSCAVRNGYDTVRVTDRYRDSAMPDASSWYKPQDYSHSVIKRFYHSGVFHIIITAEGVWVYLLPFFYGSYQS